MANIVAISEADDGQRLDRWLQNKFPHVPYPMIQKSLRNGDVRLDGKKSEGKARLTTGMQVRLPPVFRPAADNTQERGLSKAEIQKAKDMVIYEDDAIIVLNKPHGLATQGGSKTMRHVDYLLQAFKTKSGDKPKLVHRLDKETSGVLVVAKSRAVAERMGEIFKYREAKKTYLAITIDVPQRREGYTKEPLIKVGDKVVVDKENGKDAKTHYKTLAHADRDISLVALRPETGRMHQLRVHLSHILCPILGDRKYGGVMSEGRFKDASEERLWLHALCLSFPHPVSGKPMFFSAPVPKNMQKWLEMWHIDIVGLTDVAHPEDPMAHVE